MRFLKTNTATRVTVGPFLDKGDGITPETAITVTSCKLTLMVDDGGTPTLVLDAAPTASGGNNDMVHVTGDDAGFYDLELAAANVNYVGRAMLAITDAAVHCPVFHEFMILPANVYDSLVGGTDTLQADVTQWLGTAAATPSVAGVPEVDLTHVAGATTNVAALATNVDAILTDTSTTLDDLIDTEIATLITEVGKIPKSDGTSSWNATALAAIQSEANDALVAYDPPTRAEATTDVNSVLTVLGTPAGVSMSADILAIDNFVDGLETTIGAAGAGLTAVPWNAAWDAEVQSEVDDALVAQRLDELLNADSDIDGVAPPTVGSVVHELMSKTAGSFTYDQTTDSLEAIRDKETDIETDTAEIGAAGAGLTALATQASVNTIDDLLDTELPALTTEVGKIPKSDGTSSWNATALAAIQGEANDALVAYDPPTNAELTTAQGVITALLPTALVGGRIDASVGAMAANVLTAAATAADFGTEVATAVWASATRTLSALGFTLGASDLAADTIGASELAADAITEIVNAVLTTAMTESYNTDGAAPTLAQAMFVVMQRLVDFAISSTTITVKKIDGTTTAYTLTLDSATDPTSSARAT